MMVRLHESVVLLQDRPSSDYFHRLTVVVGAGRLLSVGYIG